MKTPKDFYEHAIGHVGGREYNVDEDELEKAFYQFAEYQAGCIKHDVSGKLRDKIMYILQEARIYNEHYGPTADKILAACANGAVDTVAEARVCDYCKGSGYDPYPNHDTTQRPCPECEAPAGGQP